MVKVKITGADNLQRTLKAYGAAVEKEADALVKEIAVLGAKNLASNTFPKGTSGKVKESLTKGVQKDLHKVYRPSAKSDGTDDGGYLESRRNNKGRVSRREKQMFISVSNFEEIQKNKVKTVGEVKAAWLAAAKSLVTTKRNPIPAWLRKSVERGYSMVKGARFGTTVTLVNTVRYASSVIKPADIQKSIGYAYKNYVSFINRKMAALAKKV